MLPDRQTDCQIRVKLGKAHNEHILSAFADCVAKVFLGCRTKILRTADAFYAW